MSQLNVVAILAGIPNLMTLLNALAAIFFLASSGFPSRESLRGLMLQT
jgi:hypothetical protein